MAHRTALRIALALAALAAFGAGALRRAEPRTAYVQWAGHDSKVLHESYQLIRDEPAWRALWESRAGKSEYRNFAPKIDFTQCCIAAFFRGPSNNEDGEILQSITTEPDRVVLRFVPSTFQTASFNGEDHGINTVPFGIWVIPATDKPVVVEEGRMRLGLKAEEIVYKEVHRFEAR